ncbi:MAG: hypothetical protein LBI45_05390 [Bacteroidales bacterium]|nr:hypothetical protein [Bacteroidales bacterium]
MTIFITWDVFYYSLLFASYEAKKERLEDDIKRWTQYLADCNNKDETRKKMILDKLEALRVELKKI